MNFAPPQAEVKFDNSNPWKVLVVDDEPGVHQVTKLVLSDMVLENRRVVFLDALSAAEAKIILQKETDIALIFLDVIMETDIAGLELVKWIRDELKNKLVRIVLRTGQPGVAPEEKIVLEYDINDYKEKTELVRSKLFSTTCSALKNYKELVLLNDAHNREKSLRMGLEQVVKASGHLYEYEGLYDFAGGILHQVASLLHVNENSVMAQIHGINALSNKDEITLLAGSGKYKDIKEASEEIKLLFKECLEKQTHIIKNKTFFGYFPLKKGDINLVYFEDIESISEFDLRLIDLFGSNVSTALQTVMNVHKNRLSFDNLILNLSDRLNTVHKGDISTNRVSLIAKYLANQVNLGKAELEIFSSVVPLYDIGLSLIPQEITQKSSALEENEKVIMRSHTQLGRDLLNSHDDPLLKYIAQIAYEHHERFDGSGYPRGVSSRETALASQIVGIADTFVALTSDRPYRKAWTLEQGTEYLKEQSGKLFNPELVDIFVSTSDTIKKLLQK